MLKLSTILVKGDVLWYTSHMENKKQQILTYSDREKQKIKKHIRKKFGRILGIMKEIVSSDICTDIYVVAPTNERKYFLYVTSGMGAYKMNVDGALWPVADRTELVMSIPLSWDMNSEHNSFVWPARFMKKAARFPVVTGAYLAPRHTITNGGKPFDSSTEMNSVLISSPLMLDKKSATCNLGRGKKVQFLQMIPIYKEELTAIKKKGAGDFLVRMGPELLKPLNPIRENLYKKSRSSI